MHFHRMKALLAATAFALAAGSVQAQIVSQSPLSAGGNVPGNLLLVPSVEWPTLDSQANIDANYSLTTEYVGYFDPNKCYNYQYDAVETNRFFYPVSNTTTKTCNQANKEWSGNYLNWAATQTIDPFRKALTGGYRTIDTATVTVLEKARSDGNTGSSIFNDRNISTNATFQSVTPAPGGPWDNFNTRLRTYGNKMRFTDTGDLGTTTPTAYNPATVTLDATNVGTVYEVSVRVKVCVPTLLEDNCVAYGSNYKPEGLIQKYANRMRYSAWGYLNDHSQTRDGAALRARQKYVGPTKPDPVTGVVSTNPNAEWGAADGVLVRNPDPTDATTTTTAVGASNPILDSGVINYINKFGQMTTKNHKSFDPVSEMYYASIRYLRNMGNVPEYTDLTVGATSATERYELADGFPVITTWDDPFLYYCQTNAILGIGDVNTWNDKNLKGNTVTGSEPAMPSAVSADTIDVTAWTQKVATLEGITIPTVFTGRNNSAYMVGLAYWAHTQDLRPETAMPNKQTVSTFWVDVREAQVLRDKNTNQYWLAAKYGGFTVPDTGFDSNTRTAALDTDWWYTNGDDLDPGTGVYQRADNFYVASQADEMIDSLTRAFARIVSTRVGSGSSLAANSTRIDTETRTFQAQFRSGAYGQLNSFTVLSDGSLSADPVWTAGAPLTTGTGGVALTRANWASRNIMVNAGGSMLALRDTNLTTAQKALLTFTGMPTSGLRTVSNASLVNYLRGDDSKEEDHTNGALRTRNAPATGWSPILGDIVNSTPVFVGKPSDTLYSGATFTGASSYSAFATAQASRLGVVWVGANDGMLHAFDSSTGREVFAFMPNASLLAGVANFANPEYDHSYFVDGDMAIADAYDGTSWRTILVGTMGRGGPGIFALDVTNPSSPTFLWEKGVAEIPSLGKNIGRPVIAQTANGTWKVILGNGYDSTGGVASLITITLFGGGTVSVSSVTTGGTPNGLTAVLARDSDNDGFADTAYAGDLRGNMYKFTAINGTPTRTTLFTATDGTNPQPITAAPLVGKDPSTSTVWVFFGTGKYLNTGDLTSTSRQTWYGIKDNGGSTTRATLVARTVTGTGTIGEFTVRTMSTGTAAEVAGMQGWYFDLPVSGERIVVPNRFQGGALIGTSRIPDTSDACQPTGRGFVMALNPFTGGRLDQTFFDTNHDGVFNDSDKLSGTIVSGIGFGSSANNPIFVENVMQVGLDDGSTKTIRTQGTNVDASRMSWREVTN